ncbi:MAG: cytochrome ubiquinol oxidase subunit I [Candidatus Latescibacterota bacterium]
MALDVVWLSRVQFALTVMFHYLFPPLTIGMGVVLVYLEGMYLRTREAIYETAARFWTQLFAVTFAVGVVSGIVMEFQFGTNWAAYSRYVGDVFGAALAAEGIFAFFLESGFLAVLVFGWDRVSPRFHFLGTVMVSLGSIFSAIWIIVANSWQQTPAGHRLVASVLPNGQTQIRAELLDFGQLLLNPSTLDRFVHTIIGAFMMGAFFIMSISAYYLLRDRHRQFAERSFSGALLFATVFSLAQLFSGHSNAQMVARQQPAKLAAMEAVFTTGPASLSLFGWPDAQARTTHFDLAVPGLLSLLVEGDSGTPITGLDRFRREDWPPVAPTFVSYHLMVVIGVFFIAVTVLASLLRWRGTLFQQRWLLWVFVCSVALATVANQAGWFAAEVGRQPWSVYPTFARGPDGEFVVGADGTLAYATAPGLLTGEGLPVMTGLRTRDAVSTAIGGGQVLASILMFSLIYVLLAAVWIYVLNHKIHAGPQPVSMPERTSVEGLRRAAAARTGHEGSMSEAKDQE